MSNFTTLPTRPFTRLRPVSELSIPSYFADVQTFDVIDAAVPDLGRGGPEGPAATIVDKTLQTGRPVIQPIHDDVSIATLPVYRGASMVSIVLWTTPADGVGVIEVWSPTGTHDELALTAGHFGKLERFQNVSSFVRFEKGSGLPGGVWQTGGPILHEDLPNHRGFLRAAGASAGQLENAIGLPVISSEFLASVLLISSKASPMARGVEVWTRQTDHFVLTQTSYGDIETDLQIEPQRQMDLNTGMAAMAAEHGGATTTENEAFLYAGRGASEGLHHGLAIPTYDTSKNLVAVTVLLN